MSNQNTTPNFHSNLVFDGVHVAADVNGKLWRVDADKGTAEEVKVINPRVLREYLDDDKPVFIVWNPVRTKCQKIYASGKIEGFESGSVVSNHIGIAFQQVLDKYKPEYRVKREPIDAAAIVKEICERRGISRAKLCEAVGTKTSTLQRLMSGDTKSLNLTTYNKIIAWDNSQP